MYYFQLIFVFVSCSMAIAVIIDTVITQVMDYTFTESGFSKTEMTSKDQNSA